MVYVQSSDGVALMPTLRYGKVRRLLRDKKAVVVKMMPFTVRLTYNTTAYTQEVSLGVDAGSKYIGISATTESKELFSAQIEVRTDIVKLIADRREHRDSRRSRKTRYRPARFNNRRKRKGWIAPSIRQKVEAHLKAIRMVHFILPVKRITIEAAQFDEQLIKNPCISGEQYQQGEQLGFWNVREYVLCRDDHVCQNCKGKSKDKILNVHHLESRKTGGNAPNNLITLCKTCHKALHQGEIELKKKRGTNFRDATIMNVMRMEVYNRAKLEFRNVGMTYGYITKHLRVLHDVPKSHNSDAFCVAGNLFSRRSDSFIKGRFIARHTRALHVYNPRKGGIRRRAIAPHWIGKSRLQRYDSVIWNKKKCFIYGSTNGRPIIRDIDGNLVAKTPSVNANTVIFKSRNKGLLMQVFTLKN